MRVHLLAIAHFLLLSSACAEVVLTADSSARLARERNPELQAARALVAEAEGRARRAGRLANPEVDLEAAGGQDFEGKVSIGLTQRFPLTAQLRLQKNLSALQIEQARLEVCQKEAQLSLAARQAFYELASIRESIALAGRQADAAKKWADSVGRSASEGMASPLDVGQAQLAGDRFLADQEALRAGEAVAVGRLASLLGQGADAIFAISESLALPKMPPAHRSIGFRPDVKLAELGVRAGAAEVSLARASRWEDIGVGVFVEGERFRDAPEGLEPEALVGVRLNIPLPLWSPGTIAEKQAAEERQKQLLESVRLTANNQAHAAHRAMSARYRAARLAEERSLPAARQHVAEAEAAYGRGEIDQQTLSLAREQLANSEAAAIEARKNFHLARCEWLAAVGEPNSSKP